MSTKPYTVDNEKYHRSVATQIEIARLGVSTPIQDWDGLEKKAQKFYAQHLRMPAKKRPKFPRIVTQKSLFKYRGECLRRGLL